MKFKLLAQGLRSAWANHTGAEPSESVLGRAIDEAVLALDALDAAKVEPVWLREALLQALSSELSCGVYDCTRVWEAWSVGTMDQDDFTPISERLDDIVDSVANAIVKCTAPQQAEAQPATCQYCDGTGDVHSADGEWRGRCSCEIGRSSS